MPTNHYGDEKVVAASFEPLTIDADEGANVSMGNLTVRNFTGNDTVFFGNAEGKTTGYIKADEAYTFHHVRPRDVYVKGTVGQVVYWVGDGA